MKRTAFIASAGAMLLKPLIATGAGTPTILAVGCSVPEFESQAEDTLAGALRDAGVSVVAPEAMDVTVREHLSVAVHRWFGGGSLDMDYVATITRHYNAQRAMLVDAELRASSLPYGSFTVYTANARCSYRCFDTVSKAIVVAGSTTGQSRNEDGDTAMEQALDQAVQSAAHRAARHLL